MNLLYPFDIVYANATGGVGIHTSQTQLINPNVYNSDGVGDIQAVPEDRFTIQWVYARDDSGPLVVLLGEVLYETLGDGVRAAPSLGANGPVVLGDLADYRYDLTIQGGTTDLIDPDRAWRGRLYFSDSV